MAWISVDAGRAPAADAPWGIRGTSPTRWGRGGGVADAGPATKHSPVATAAVAANVRPSENPALAPARRTTPPELAVGGASAALGENYAIGTARPKSGSRMFAAIHLPFSDAPPLAG